MNPKTESSGAVGHLFVRSDWGYRWGSAVPSLVELTVEGKRHQVRKAQSVERLASDQVTISQFVGLSPNPCQASDSVLTA